MPNASRAVALLFSLVSLGACTDSGREETGEAQARRPALNTTPVLGTLPPACGQWTNPTVPLKVRGLQGQHPDQTRVPEGLTLLNAKGEAPARASLDCKKPTVIYIHGWTTDGAAETVPFVEAWAPRFNVFIYRWHRLSYGAQTPLNPENHVPTARVRLDKEVTALVSKLGGSGYRSEIRVVAHSLGSQLALPLMQDVLGDGLLRPRRLELLDPYLWIDLRQIDAVTGESFPHEHAELLRMARAMGVKTAVYATSVSNLIGKTLRDVSNIQAMHPRWLGGDRATAHKRVVQSYFGSLRFPPPALEDAEGGMTQAFSASLESSKFPNAKVLFEQTETALNEEQMQNHTYRRLRDNSCGQSIWKYSSCL